MRAILLLVWITAVVAFGLAYYDDYREWATKAEAEMIEREKVLRQRDAELWRRIESAPKSTEPEREDTGIKFRQQYVPGVGVMPMATF